MSIIITGASGQLGRATIDYALETVEPGDLTLVTRSPDALSDYEERGARVRHGDFNAPSTLPEAFRGGKRMLLISTDAIGERVAQHAAAIETATDAGVELVAYTSIINAVADNPAFVVPDHRATEQELIDSGIGWTFLRNSLYADFQEASMAAAAGSGVLATNEGNGKIAYVSRDDCAAAAAAVLVGGNHAGGAYDITGPELIDAARRAEIFSEITGQEIEVLHVDDDEYAHGMVDATGMSMEGARGMASFGAAVREGHFQVQSSDFEKLTGRQPADLSTTLSG